MKGISEKGAALLAALGYTILGVILIFNPLFLDTVCRITGILMMAGGVCLMVKYLIDSKRFANKDNSYMYKAIFFMIAGVFLLLVPSFLNFLIPTAIGLVIIVNGFGGMTRAYNSRKRVPNWLAAFILFFLLVIIGAVIIIKQKYFMNTVKWFIGASLIAAGLMHLINIFLAKPDNTHTEIM